MEGIPKDKRNELLEAICYAYPAWFFEVLVQFGAGPLVLEPFQIKALTNIDQPFMIVNKSRQSGGSLIFALEQMYRAITTYDYRCDVVSLNISEATDKIRYIRNAWETLPLRYQPPLFKDNALSIGFHDGRRSSIVNSLAPTSAVRGGRKSLLLDEFAHIHPKRQQEIYTAALPAMLNSVPGQELTVRIVSTPLGDTNKFSEIWFNKEDAYGRRMYDKFLHQQFIWLDVKRFFDSTESFEKAQHEWYVKYNQDFDYMDSLIDTYGNDTVREIRYALSREDFLQEMCGSFITYKDQFFKTDLISKCCKSKFTEADIKSMNLDDAAILGDLNEELGFEVWEQGRPKIVEGDIYMGIDFGESIPGKDKTCIQILHKDKTGRFFQRYSLTLDDYKFGDFTIQSQIIADVYKRYRPSKVIVDGTALGRAVSDILQKDIPGINLEEVTFTNLNKEEMMVNLRLLMESNKIWLQDDDKPLQRELRNIQRTTSRAGNVQFHGNPHDDRVMALALATKSSVYRPFAVYVLG